jgi:hypothetical protein
MATKAPTPFGSRPPVAKADAGSPVAKTDAPAKQNKFSIDTMRQTSTMKVSELKQELESYGISVEGFFIDKSDLVAAVEKARLDYDRKPPGTSTKASSSGRFTFGTTTSSTNASYTFTFDGAPFSSSSQPSGDVHDDDGMKDIGQKIDAKAAELTERIRKLTSVSEALQKRHQDILKRQNALKEDHGGSDVSPSDVIQLNVGGTEMIARRGTLTAIKGSRLEVLFSGRWENKLLRDEDGRVFMDLDPVVFKSLLDLLFIVKMNPSAKIAHESDMLSFYMTYFVEPVSNQSKSKTKDGQKCKKSTLSEEDFLQDFASLLDEMESALEAEEAFVQYFTINQNETEELHADLPKSNSISSDTDDVSVQEEKAYSDVLDYSKSDLKKTQNRECKSSPILNLVVGGDYMAVKKTTISVYPESKLAKFILNEILPDDKNVIVKDGKVYHVVDIPNFAFHEILKILRLRSMKIIDVGSPFCIDQNTEYRTNFEYECSKAVIMHFLGGCQEIKFASSDTTSGPSRQPLFGSSAAPSSSGTTGNANSTPSFSFTSPDTKANTTATPPSGGFTFGSTSTSVNNNPASAFGTTSSSGRRKASSFGHRFS